MAARFWVGGTGTWDASTTTNWASSSGGAGGQSVPGSADDVTFDGSSGGGTVTVNATVNIKSLTWGAFTGTLDFSVNNNTVTLVNFSGTGTGARKFLMGSGQWTLNAGTTGTWNLTTTTNLDAGSVFTAPVTFNLTTTNISFSGGAKSWGAFTIAGTLSSGQSPYFQIEQGNNVNNTFASLSVSGVGLSIQLGTTQTITNALTITGNSTNQILISSNSAASVRATIAIGAASTATYAAFRDIAITTSTLTTTNSFDLGGNTGFTINAPAGGGGSHFVNG